MIFPLPIKKTIDLSTLRLSPLLSSASKPLFADTVNGEDEKSIHYLMCMWYSGDVCSTEEVGAMIPL